MSVSYEIFPWRHTLLQTNGAEVSGPWPVQNRKAAICGDSSEGILKLWQVTDSAESEFARINQNPGPRHIFLLATGYQGAVMN